MSTPSFKILSLVLVIGIATSITAHGSAEPTVEHVIVYHETDKFAGWPANSGMWMWADEILVGYTLGDYWGDIPKGHHIKNRQGTRFARSLDGGKTWKQEHHENVNATPTEALPGGIDFSRPGFAMLLQLHGSINKGPSVCLYSYDRGQNWRGPYWVPEIGLGVITRTDYIVDGKDSCTFMFTCAKQAPNKKRLVEGRVGCVRTEDGGKTLELVGWVGDVPDGFEIMPSTVRCSNQRLVTAIRVAQGKDGPHIAVRRSDDNGRTWEELVRIPNSGNSQPAALVRTPDGLLCMAYGHRQHRSIFATISADDGQTWPEPKALRTDGASWDIGYCRSVLRDDGKIVTAYYFSTEERPEMHIAATIWAPADLTP